MSTTAEAVVGPADGHRPPAHSPDRPRRQPEHRQDHAVQRALRRARRRRTFPARRPPSAPAAPRWPDGDGHVDVIDLPGVYDLYLEAPESAIARAALDGVGQRAARRAGNRGGRVQPRTQPRPRRTDAAEPVPHRRGAEHGGPGGTAPPDDRRRGPARRLGVPVVPIIARKSQGLDALRGALSTAWRARPADLPADTASPEQLMAWAEAVAADVTTADAAAAAAVDARTEQVDRILTHPVLGLLVFMAVMGGLFWTLFALANSTPMDLHRGAPSRAAGPVRRRTIAGRGPCGI